MIGLDNFAKKIILYSYETNAILDANASMILLFHALSFSSFSEKVSCVRGFASLANPSKANNFRIVPECVKWIFAVGPSFDL